MNPKYTTISETPNMLAQNSDTVKTTTTIRIKKSAVKKQKVKQAFA